MDHALEKELEYIEGLSKRGLHEDAFGLCQKLLDAYPNFYKIYEVRSSIFRRIGDFERAIEDIDQVLRLAPSTAAPYFRKGRYLMLLERYRDAAVEFTNAIKFDNGYFGDTLLFYRAEALLRVGSYEKCLKDCRGMRSNYSESSFFGHRTRTRTEIENDALAGLERNKKGRNKKGRS